MTLKAHEHVKDAFIRAAARLTGERVTRAALAEAFTELAGGIAWMTRIPGAQIIAHDFARMMVEKLTEVRTTDVTSETENVRQSLDLQAEERKLCPHCGKPLPFQ